MPAATFARGSDPGALARDTLEQLRIATGSQPVRAGILYASGVAHAALAKALKDLLPGVELLGATALDAGPGLAGFWLTGNVRVAVATGEKGKDLADAAIVRAGFGPFRTRLAMLNATSCASLLGGIFDVLPKGAAFVGADLAEVWTGEGPVAAALLVSDWQTRIAVGFEGCARALERKGLPPESVVGMLRLRTGQVEEVPKVLAKVPQVAALVRAIHGVPDRAPEAPTTAEILFSSLKERAES